MSPLLFASARTTSLPLCSVRLLISIPWAEKKPFLIPRSIGSAFAIGSVATVTVASCRLPAVSRALAVAPPNSAVAAKTAIAVTRRRPPEPLATRFISRPFCRCVARPSLFAMRTKIRSPHGTFDLGGFAVKWGPAGRRRGHGTQLRLDRLGGPQQLGQHLLAQVLHGHPARVDRDVHRCRYGPARVADRNGDRAHPLL